MTLCHLPGIAGATTPSVDFSTIVKDALAAPGWLTRERHAAARAAMTRFPAKTQRALIRQIAFTRSMYTIKSANMDVIRSALQSGTVPAETDFELAYADLRRRVQSTRYETKLEMSRLDDVNILDAARAGSLARHFRVPPGEEGPLLRMMVDSLRAAARRAELLLAAEWPASGPAVDYPLLYLRMTAPLRLKPVHAPGARDRNAGTSMYLGPARQPSFSIQAVPHLVLDDQAVRAGIDNPDQTIDPLVIAVLKSAFERDGRLKDMEMKLDHWRNHISFILSGLGPGPGTPYTAARVIWAHEHGQMIVATTVSPESRAAAIQKLADFTDKMEILPRDSR